MKPFANIIYKNEFHTKYPTESFIKRIGAL